MPEQLELQEAEQSSLCTCDEHCEAAADEHFEDCPVEQELRETFGF